MNEFDEYIKDKYPSDYLLMTVRYPDQELCELYPDQFEVWRYQQDRIDGLQARVDKALKNVEMAFDKKDWAVVEAIRILKGSKDEPHKS